MPITLRSIRAAEFETWLPTMRDGYARDLELNGGLARDQARRKASTDIEQLFPHGEQSSDQSVFVIEVDDEAVGNLWVSEREMNSDRHLWIYDIRIRDDYRGRGYGRRAMLLAEVEARRRGLNRVALNVFGGNEVARGLYRSLNYTENAIVMSKPVGSGLIAK